ncbi:MAG: hypothetical protein HYZ21_03290 [Chloroflexi bacterium]|nr:hypothetical protein [Chloroflexota bacterium]
MMARPSSWVHWTAGIRRRFQVVCLAQAGSVKAALSRPIWLSTGEAVSSHTSSTPAVS